MNEPLNPYLHYPTTAQFTIHKGVTNGEHIVQIDDGVNIDIIKCKDGFNLSNALYQLKSRYINHARKDDNEFYWRMVTDRLTELLDAYGIKYKVNESVFSQ